MTNKVKITQKEFDDIYEIDPIEKEIVPKEEEQTEPDFLTEEEQEHDKLLFDTLEIPEDDKS